MTLMPRPVLSARKVASAALAGLCIALAGCSSTRVLEHDVQAYSTLAVMPQPATYRLERLPSQQAASPWRDMVERQASAALAQVGMQRDDAHGAMRLEIEAQARTYRPDWPHYGGYFSGYFGYGFLSWHPLWGWGYWDDGRDRPPTLYLRQVRLILRDAQGAVAYESSARYDDIWAPDELVFRQLFQAALEGFPTPPQGERRIRYAIER